MQHAENVVGLKSSALGGLDAKRALGGSENGLEEQRQFWGRTLKLLFVIGAFHIQYLSELTRY